MNNINTMNIFIFIFALTISFFVAISANDMIILLLAIELQSLSSFILTAYKFYNVKSTEAAIKYFILGSFSSIIFILGIVLIYSLTGTFNIKNIYNILLYETTMYNTNYYISIIFITLFFNLFFKLAVVPFHFWIVDVYENAPMISIIIFAILNKIANILILLKISFEFINIFLNPFIISLFAFFSILLGSIGAIIQNNIKRFIAYSAITNIGFILICLNISSYLAIYSIIFFMYIYIILTIILFVIMLNLRNFSDFYCQLDIYNYKYLVDNKSQNIIIFLTLLSFAGIPPFSGFFSKFNIIISILQFNMFLSSIIITILSIIIAVYYLRIIRFLFFNLQLKEKRIDKNTFEKKSCYIITFFSILNIFFLFFSGHYSILIFNGIKYFFEG